MSLSNKTLFITGASRGIGLAIALRAARDGANIAIAAKTVKPDPRLPGTIFTAAEDIEKAGGKALPLPCDIRDEQIGAVVSSAKYLNENMEKAPVFMIPRLEGRPEGTDAGVQASCWGSLLPAVWSYMLALRERGLGSAWTTLHLIGEGEKKAADLLGIPYEQYTQGGLFPIAYTKGTDFKLAKRLPAEQLTHWDTW